MVIEFMWQMMSVLLAMPYSTELEVVSDQRLVLPLSSVPRSTDADIGLDKVRLRRDELDVDAGVTDETDITSDLTEPEEMAEEDVEVDEEEDVEEDEDSDDNDDNDADDDDDDDPEGDDIVNDAMAVEFINPVKIQIEHDTLMGVVENIEAAATLSIQAEEQLKQTEQSATVELDSVDQARVTTAARDAIELMGSISAKSRRTRALMKTVLMVGARDQAELVNVITAAKAQRRVTAILMADVDRMARARSDIGSVLNSPIPDHFQDMVSSTLDVLDVVNEKLNESLISSQLLEEQLRVTANTGIDR